MEGRLQSRVFMEYLPRTILPQRIASVLQQNTADIYSSYYPATDSLLMACLPSTAPGRLRSTSWVARDHVRHRPAFKDWKQKLLISNEYLTPRSEAAAAACVPLSAGQLEFVATQSWSMYPADHSVVRTCQTPRGSLWLTVYLHGCVDMLVISSGFATQLIASCSLLAVKRLAYARARSTSQRVEIIAESPLDLTSAGS